MKKKKYEIEVRNLRKCNNFFYFLLLLNLNRKRSLLYEQGKSHLKSSESNNFDQLILNN